MDSKPTIDSLKQFSMPFKGELVRWLETYFGQTKGNQKSGITGLTSDDGSITIANPGGPSADLSNTSNQWFLIERYPISQNVNTDVTLSPVPVGFTGVSVPSVSFPVSTTYAHLVLVVSIATNDGSNNGTDLNFWWNSGITTFNFVSMVNGVVTASSLTNSASSIVVPGVLPFSNGGASYAHLYFHFPYYNVYMGTSPHGVVRSAYWHGSGTDGAGKLGLHQGVASSGSMIAGSGSATWDSIKSITLNVSTSGKKWELGEANLYGIVGGSQSKDYP